MAKPNLQAVRAQFEVGEQVYVQPRNQGGAAAESARPRKARIVELMGTAAAVIFDDNRREIAMIKRLAKIADTSNQNAAQSSTVVAPVAVVTATESGPQDDVAIWLEMGRTLAAQMTQSVSAKRGEAVELRAEAQALLDAAAACEQEADRLGKRLADILKVARAVSLVE